MYNFIELLIYKIKGEQFKLDRNIPITYLFSFSLKKACSLIWGMFKVRRVGKYFVHSSSRIRCVSKIRLKGVINIDRGCYIDALSVNGINFGKNVSVGKNTTIECSGTLKDIGLGLVIGDNVGLGTHGFFGCAGGIVIGNDTIFGNYVTLHSENHNYKDADELIRLQGVNRKGIKIGRNCWIGAKATILDGSIIGDGCIVAAGAVVSGVFEDNMIIGGIPARVIKPRLVI